MSLVLSHERYAKDFTEGAKFILTKEHLKKVCKRYQDEKGLWLRREPVAIFKRPDSVVVIGKQFCSKGRGEHLTEIILVHSDGKYLVDHAMVF